jgi:prepilin-type N-terminal cleavage/methylation domain-containing protein
MTTQRGFSLVEVIAAMVILTVGVLGLAASAAAVGRLTTEGARMSGAANAASSKFEELRAQACASMAAGADEHPGGYARRWTVSTSGNTATITLVVSYSNGRKTRTTTYVSERSCV